MRALPCPAPPTSRLQLRVSERPHRYWTLSLLIHLGLVGSSAFIAFSVNRQAEEGPTVWMEESPRVESPALKPPMVVAASIVDRKIIDEPAHLVLRNTAADALLSNDQRPEIADDNSSFGKFGRDDWSLTHVDRVIAISGYGNYLVGNQLRGSGGKLGLEENVETAETAYGTPLEARTENSRVDEALKWLAYHQESDGHWAAPDDVTGNSVENASLAILAFLYRGHNNRVGQYKDNVRNGVAWLLKHQSNDAGFRDPSHTSTATSFRRANYLATLALCETAYFDDRPFLRESTQEAIRYSAYLHRESPAGERNNEPWFTLALKSALSLHLKVEPDAVEDIFGAFTSTETLRPGALLHRPERSPFPRIFSCGGVYSIPFRSTLQDLNRLYNIDPNSTYCTLARDFINAQGFPRWNENGASVDLPQWLDGNLRVAKAGGDLYRTYRAPLVQALLSNQCMAGDDNGSWPAVGPQATHLGRAGQTAMACLCLEAYLGKRRRH